MNTDSRITRRMQSADFLGARYCMLRFDSSDRCEGVTLIGVSATTKKDPARR